MKKKGFLLCTVMMALSCLLAACALADGTVRSTWVHSDIHRDLPLASYVGEYDGYVCVDDMGRVGGEDPGYLTVISKSASIWSEPRTNSKKLGSASHGDRLLGYDYTDRGDVVMHDGFYAVDYKGSIGWVNADYVVRNTLEIVLMESNVPAYIAPDVRSKKVGSLAKLTRYRVIGLYDDFYIVNLRGAAAAYIPMSVRHYDSLYEFMYRQSASYKGRANVRTALRTGPGEEYAQADMLSAGEQFECIDRVDGWYMLQYTGAGTDGGAYVYVDSADVTVDSDGWLM